MLLNIFAQGVAMNTDDLIFDFDEDFNEVQLRQRKKPLKERDLYLPLKQFFESDGFEIYAEVPCSGATADIVARKNNIFIVVEMKTAINLKLIEQVFNWRNKAHFVYAAVPRRTEISMFARQLLKDAGIGLLVLDIDNRYGDPYCSRIYKMVRAQLNRVPIVRWEQHIIPEYSQNIAGVQHPDIKASRYKIMMKHVKRLIERHKDGISIDEIAELIDSYYVDPKKGLFNALKKYESDWCEPFKKPGDRKSYFRLKLQSSR